MEADIRGSGLFLPQAKKKKTKLYLKKYTK
jgi:hypothetical protein